MKHGGGHLGLKPNGLFFLSGGPFSGPPSPARGVGVWDLAQHAHSNCRYDRWLTVLHCARPLAELAFQLHRNNRRHYDRLKSRNSSQKLCTFIHHVVSPPTTRLNVAGLDVEIEHGLITCGEVCRRAGTQLPSSLYCMAYKRFYINTGKTSSTYQ